MAPTLHSYPAYRPSGVKWLGDVPERWEIQRLKHLLQERDDRSPDGREQLLRVSQYTGVTQREQIAGRDGPDTRAESLVGYKRVRPDDLVVNIMLAWNGSMGVSRFRGIASPAYCVYRFLPGAHPWYFHHLLRSPDYKAYIKTASTGVVESRLRLYTDDLFRLNAPIPPLSEQTAIVRYLDHVDRCIRRYVGAKRKLIALLEEEKQAVINQAVTRGLDRNVPLKPSGVKWLGDVPEHWEVQRLKTLAQIRYGLGQPPAESADGLPLIRATNVYRGRIIDKDMVYVDPDDVPKGRNALLSEREIIVVRSGAYTADSAIVPTMFRGAVTGYDMVVTVNAALPEFIALVLLATYVLNDQLIVASMRSAQPHLNAEELGSASVLLPPFREQTAIVEFLDKATADIDAAIVRTHRQIELLEEYRTRLIADVVTGKLDVREAAARLPNEPGDADGAEADGPAEDVAAS